MRLLLVEDDPGLSRSLKADLERAGFAVDLAMDGENGEFMGMTESYDIVILDLGLPKMPGLEVLRRWRQAGNHVPVIVLTARDAWHEKVDGFKAGADDYLGKPFHIEELQARIQALLKRLHGRMQPQLYACGVSLDEDRQTVCVDGAQHAELTAIEFRLLRYFMLHPGKLLTKTHLLEHVYECDSDPASNVIEVYINRLRRKLGKDLIATRRGQGYVFGEKP
ncbi:MULTISPECIES: response regulator transcription factor [Methylomonas]|uniref:Two-component system response regulator n=2 Tax=Methylomonas TaxID=416 RepID=A0A140E6K9_9GAMM|nr:MULTISPECIES: response regulator transcription factor [Methylomonas]AMK79033.1 two-component system response regulator [Methylomonas denitrificans]OAI00196.1 DNA-binding response regulator [Methylomonas methanica]TCV79174.1 winged helix family two component transcriptional regulator [Methylomonas methanica]